MSANRRPIRDIICEVCGKPGRSALKDRAICRGCHRAEASMQCARCGMMKHDVFANTGLCLRCTKITARSRAICARCSRLRIIFDERNNVCEPCHQLMLRRARAEAKPKVECSVCGALRPSILTTRAICQACWRMERNGYSVCERCKRLKVIQVKSDCICKQCYKDVLAPNALRGYVNNFMTPFAYNRVLFEILAATIDWRAVNQKVDRRIRAFGRFLESYQFKEPLSWEAIEEALPALGPTRRNNPKQVRASLFDLGHALVANGKLEPRETYVARRNALLPLTRASQRIQPLLEQYASWLCERKTKLTSVREHMEGLARFWSWCDHRGIRSPSEVQVSLVKDYLLALCWEWQCSGCGATAEFDPRKRNPPGMCSRCNALHSFSKVKRYSQNTVRNERAKLPVFFDWCKISRMVLTNPVQIKVPAPTPSIRHYLPEVVRSLCTYAAASDSDPMEAMALFLILFYALSVEELRHTRIPVVHPLRQGTLVPSLSEAYYLIVPKPSPSIGDRSPGRPNVRLDFPPSAAPWLRDLLDRYEQHRRQFACNPANEYLFVSAVSGRRNMPVSHVFLWDMVRRVTLRVLGSACNPNTLRKPAGVMFADRAGAGVLRWMGWSEQQAFAYAWADREVMHPRRELGPDLSEIDPTAGSVVFPRPV